MYFQWLLAIQNSQNSTESIYLPISNNISTYIAIGNMFERVGPDSHHNNQCIMELDKDHFNFGANNSPGKFLFYIIGK